MAWIMDTYSQHKGHALPRDRTGKPVAMAARSAGGTPRDAASSIRSWKGRIILVLISANAPQSYKASGTSARWSVKELASAGVKMIAVSDRTGGF